MVLLSRCTEGEEVGHRSAAGGWCRGLGAKWLTIAFIGVSLRQQP